MVTQNRKPTKAQVPSEPELDPEMVKLVNAAREEARQRYGRLLTTDEVLEQVREMRAG